MLNKLTFFQKLKFPHFSSLTHTCSKQALPLAGGDVTIPAFSYRIETVSVTMGLRNCKET